MSATEKRTPTDPPAGPDTALMRLRGVMATLRDPNHGCPWDLQQDAQTLRPYVIEEAYEVTEAIDRGDPMLLKEELGDLLFQIVFHTQLAEEQGSFSFDDVARHVTDKMVSRHPHIFGDLSVQDAAEVKRNWEQLKAAEKPGRGALDGVPDALPGLLKALRVGEKAANMGFDWADKHGVEAKVHEEWGELQEAAEEGDREAMEHELGDLLFSIANLARHLGLDAEIAIQGAARRFTSRFEHMEHACNTRGLPMSELDMDALETLWETAKTATGTRSRDETGPSEIPGEG